MASDINDDGFSFLDPLIGQGIQPSDKNPEGWRVRLRFHCASAVQSENAALDFVVGEYGAKISSTTGGEALNSKRLVLNIRGISEELEARRLGERVAASIHVAGAIRKFGVDLGEDKATAMLFNGAKKAVFDRVGVTIRDDVHGQDVFFDNGLVRHFGINATATVTTRASIFSDEISTVFEWIDGLPESIIEFAKLLNRADMSLDPAAKLAVSFSAIEASTEPISWSGGANKFLEELVKISAQKSDFEESEEIKARLETMKNLGPSSNKRVRALLSRLGLSQLAPILARHYKIRSKLVHGVHVPMSALREASSEVRDIAGQIFEKSIEPFQHRLTPTQKL